MRQGPPLPIPNREVKPARADDTAIPGGKVGRRQLYKNPVAFLLRGFFVPENSNRSPARIRRRRRRVANSTKSLSHLFEAGFF